MENCKSQYSFLGEVSVHLMGVDCLQQNIRNLDAMTQFGRPFSVTIAGDTCSWRRTLKLGTPLLLMQATSANGRDLKSSIELTLSPMAPGIDQGSTGWHSDVAIARFRFSKVRF